MNYYSVRGRICLARNYVISYTLLARPVSAANFKLKLIAIMRYARSNKNNSNCE